MERDNNYNQQNNLQELGGSDFEIADNQPNIKGWTVKDSSGQTIGEVDELIFDVQARKVRYMVVDLEGNVLDLDTRDVLVPIGIAELQDDGNNVILPNVTADQLRSLPTYEKGRFDREHESSIRSIFSGAGAAAAGAGAALTGSNRATDRDGFYEHDHFSDRLFNRGTTTDTGYTAPTTTTGSNQDETVIPIIEENLQVGKEEVETGGVHVSSRIVERPVEEHVRLREERVVVERTPVDRPASERDLDNFQEGEIELTEHAEVPIVNKEARVVEEVSLEKEVEEHDEVIRDSVRSTEVEVDDLHSDTTNRTGYIPDTNLDDDLDRDRTRRSGLDNDPNTTL
ncbi:DUF2382 domain-containing protein [Rufibacter latericius]|uniref:DUF2382 domain-containing protein n=1 Tax=Rufibacter latericius TaxID=2487040 RepID=A0A3M9M8G7_9BACT|nr:PRC and DUF2382 domain-containing protein [Rufibacter latericius]RNI21869.1 DUF2382 domain-containing protein [Rufibacter latericius]